MKHVFKTSLILGLLLLVFEPKLTAQDSINNNRFIHTSQIEEEFRAFLRGMDTIPDSDYIILQYFWENYNDKIILLDTEDASSYDPLFYNEERNKKIIIDNCLIPILKEEKELRKAPSMESPKGQSHHYWIWIAIAVLTFALLYFIKNRKKDDTVIVPPDRGNDINDTSDNDIVIRRKTTTVLKKQSLDDVLNNDEYMKIDCADFCDDSAVKRIFIKNTCIKEVYNMYAEDLRDSGRPKEDGCMVLGRWIYDENTDEYQVSLEHVVFPGDDAVLSEYELNFGAKIKLNIMTKLRKLRQETDLQYDLTCWIHSHPEMGVFFSNTDLSLHMLHKHPTHPRFLIAIVVDILTPQQELGIFTFKHDESVNSKAELKKTYSLEEWHKWAVESSRNAFKAEDHFNTMQEVSSRIENCHDIHLSNSTIIDMGKLVTDHQEGFIGNVYGYVNQKTGNAEYIATKASASEVDHEHELIGSFIIVTHCSIPSVRKALANQLNNIGFVLVYSTTDGLLTSIPVVNNDLCNDQNFYGEQKLEDLKIWTRRKR